MFIQLPNPYPDELFYSVLARYFIHSGSRTSPAIKELFGRQVRGRVDLVLALNTVSERTWATWRMSAEDIANRLTLFPYYARHVPTSRAEQCLESLKSGSGIGVHLRLGVNSSRLKHQKFLRYCPRCCASDIAGSGETYWRRSHQLIGVLVCNEHRDFLVSSKALFHPTGWADFQDATTSISLDVPNSILLSEHEIDLAVRIARHCQEFLEGLTPSWDHKNIPDIYRRGAIERGLFTGAANLSHTKIREAFFAFYGEELLTQLGVTIGDGVDNWLREIFRSSKKTFHSAEHAIIQVFLESIPVSQNKAVPFGFGPWKCPNPYANHSDQFPIKRVAMRLDDTGLVASVKCTCGFQFSFRKLEADTTLPVVSRIAYFGKTWEDEATRLKCSGLSIRAIGRVMGIYTPTVKRLLTPKPVKIRFSVREISLWRAEWIALLDESPNKSRHLAAQKNRKLYTKLLKWDAAWLHAPSSQRGWNRRTLNKRADWGSRDLAWVEQLRSASQEIRSKFPLRRATKTAIILAAGLKESTIAKNLYQLPACARVLEECRESKEDWRARLLRAASAKARELNMPRKAWIICKLAGLRPKGLGDRLATLLQTLIEEI